MSPAELFRAVRRCVAATGGQRYPEGAGRSWPASGGRTTTETSQTTKQTRTKWVDIGIFKSLTVKAGILQSQDSYCNLRIADYTVTYAERPEFSMAKGGKVKKIP